MQPAPEIAPEAEVETTTHHQVCTIHTPSWVPARWSHTNAAARRVKPTDARRLRLRGIMMVAKTAGGARRRPGQRPQRGRRSRPAAGTSGGARRKQHSLKRRGGRQWPWQRPRLRESARSACSKSSRRALEKRMFEELATGARHPRGPLVCDEMNRDALRARSPFISTFVCVDYRDQKFSARGFTLPRIGATAKAPRIQSGGGRFESHRARWVSFFLLFRSGVSRGVGSPLGRGLFWGVFCGATRCEGEGGRAGLPRGQTALQREALYVAVARCS